MTAKKRTDIYNANLIAGKLPEEIKNRNQKVTSLLLGTNFYSTNADIDALIKVLNAEHKETINKLKALRH